MTRTRIAILIACIATLFGAITFGLIVYSLMQPRVVVWDLRSSDNIAVVGWKPHGRWDIDYGFQGDFDFTLYGDSGHKLHQRVSSFGCGRIGNRINTLFCCLKGRRTIDQAVIEAKHILDDWADGPGAYPDGATPYATIDLWYEAVKARKIPVDQTGWDFIGKSNGRVRFTIMGNIHDGGQCECMLSFSTP